MNKCDNYFFNWEDLLIPPRQTYVNLCLSQDKTRLFLSTILRVIILYFISSSIPKEMYGSHIILLLLFMYLVYNGALIVGVIVKQSKFTKQ